VNRLTTLCLISLIALGTAGCGHEARVTGPTQCLAPPGTKIVGASEMAQGRTDLSQHTAFDSAESL
jgi:hypothetical protein